MLFEKLLRVSHANIKFLFQAALNAMKYGSPFLRRSMGGVMDVLEQNTFVKLTVRKLLFGYANPLLKLSSNILPPEKRWPHKLFGLMVGVMVD